MGDTCSFFWQFLHLLILTIFFLSGGIRAQENGIPTGRSDSSPTFYPSKFLTLDGLLGESSSISIVEETAMILVDHLPPVDATVLCTHFVNRKLSVSTIFIDSVNKNVTCRTITNPHSVDDTATFLAKASDAQRTNKSTSGRPKSTAWKTVTRTITTTLSTKPSSTSPSPAATTTGGQETRDDENEWIGEQLKNETCSRVFRDDPDPHGLTKSCTPEPHIPCMDVNVCVGEEVVDDDDDHDAAFAALAILVFPMKWSITYRSARYDGVSRPKYLQDLWHKGLDKVLPKKKSEVEKWWQKENQGMTFDDDISLEDVEVLGDPVESALTVLDPMPMDLDEPVNDPTDIPPSNAPGSLVLRAAQEPDPTERAELNRLVDNHLERVKRRWPKTFLRLLRKLKIDISFENFERDLKHEANRQFEWRNERCRDLFEDLLEEDAERMRSEAVKYLDNITNTPAVPKKWPTKKKLEEEERMIETVVENLLEAVAKTKRAHYRMELKMKHKAEAKLLIQQEMEDRRILFASLPRATPA